MVKVGDIVCLGRKERVEPKGVGGEVKDVLKIDEGVGKEPAGGIEIEAKVMCKFMPLTKDIGWASKSFLRRLL